MKFCRLKYYIIIIGIFLFLPFVILRATSLGHISDELSNSAPNENSNHKIKFFNPSFIPASGRIVITPEAGRLNIPAGLDYTDLDLAVSPTTEENYVDRNLSSAPDAVFDGVSVVAGANGSITITLNSSSGINAGVNVMIKIGTNATFNETGDQQIVNPIDLGNFKMTISTIDDVGTTLDSSIILLSTADHVEMSTYMIKIRSNGKPTISDILTAESTITIMSLTTNYRSWCRFAHSLNGDNPLASTTTFYDMTEAFTNTGQFYHSIFLLNLPFGYHQYYVRCLDQNLVADDTSYLIHFRKASPGEGDSGTGAGSGSTGTGSGGGSGDSEGSGSRGRGGGGGGSGGGTGSSYGPNTGDLKPYPPELSKPDITLQGWAYPGSVITVLQDGKAVKTVNADTKGEFKADFFSLTKGVYTYGINAKDTEGRQSETVNSTVWLNEGAQMTVSQIFIPPSISLKNNSVGLGEPLNASGQSVPGALVELSLYSSSIKTPTASNTLIFEVTADANGRWAKQIETKGIAKGEYRIRARSKINAVGYSSYSKVLDVGIGVTIKIKKMRSDLNFDGKVNLLDFSILLYWWNSTNKLADINEDGKVNIIDFSLMMFDWTG